MPNGSEEKTEKVNWVRKPRRADLSEVNLRKLHEAHQRGVRIDLDVPTNEHNPNKELADVTKVVVEGMPAPSSPDDSSSESS